MGAYFYAGPVSVYSIGGDLKVFAYLDGKKMLSPIHESFDYSLRANFLIPNVLGAFPREKTVGMTEVGQR